MKKRTTLFIALLSLMLFATSICAMAAQTGQIISSGSVTLELESEASNELLIEGDTISHDDADLTLKIYLDYKPTSSGSITYGLKSWTYTKDADNILSKSRYYTATASGYYRLRGYHAAYMDGYGTETLDSETGWIQVR